jgi:hypothetical protein
LLEARAGGQKPTCEHKAANCRQPSSRMPNFIGIQGQTQNPSTETSVPLTDLELNLSNYFVTRTKAAYQQLSTVDQTRGPRKRRSQKHPTRV